MAFAPDHRVIVVDCEAFEAAIVFAPGLLPPRHLFHGFLLFGLLKSNIPHSEV